MVLDRIVRMAIEEPSYGGPLVTVHSVSLNDEVVLLCRQLITPSGWQDFPD